jgi:hypothetical protein
MQPSGDSGDSSSEEEEEEEDSSITSEDAEEMAYLRQVEKSIPVQRNNTIQQRNKSSWNDRASSRASSHHSMMTAPTELSKRRPSSSTSLTSHSIRPLSRNNRPSYEEHFDDSVNPWVLHPSSRQYRVDSRLDIYRSPMSTSSSVTATQYNNNTTSERFTLGRLNDSNSTQQQHVLLGPATKRALESIQHEIEALNERINGLRDEIVNRDTTSRRNNNSNTVIRRPILPDDGWKWVIKVIFLYYELLT